MDRDQERDERTERQARAAKLARLASRARAGRPLFGGAAAPAPAGLAWQNSLAPCGSVRGRTAARPGGGLAFGARLGRLRWERKMTRKALARRAGLDPSTLSRFEAGLSLPGFCAVVGLAHGLGVTPNELFGWEGP